MDNKNLAVRCTAMGRETDVVSQLKREINEFGKKIQRKKYLNEKDRAEFVKIEDKFYDALVCFDKKEIIEKVKTYASTSSACYRYGDKCYYDKEDYMFLLSVMLKCLSQEEIKNEQSETDEIKIELVDEKDDEFFEDVFKNSSHKN